MESMLSRIQHSPAAARALPYFIVVLLTALQGKLGPSSLYWVYALKMLVGGWLIWSLRGAIEELRWTFSWVAVAAGVGVFLLWIGLEGLYPPLDQLWSGTSGKPAEIHPATGWQPFRDLGSGSFWAWAAISVRILGSSVIIPPIEEAFFRSLVWRSIENQNFLSVPLAQFAAKGFLVTSLVFGLVHREWLPGILCGMIYHALVLRRGHLGEAMVAHGITNFLLGVWVVWKGAWNFW